MPDHPFPDLNNPKWTNQLLVLVVGVAIVTTLLTLSPNLWDRYQVVNDVQNSYWMARFQDPALFKTDYLFERRLVSLEFWGTQLILYPRSLGYGLFFYLVSFIIDHIWLSKWLIFILLPLSVIYLFKIGIHVGNNLTAVSLSLMFIFFMQAAYQSISPASGLQRGFALPLLIIFLYYIICNQYTRSGVMIVLSTLFYWPAFPLMILTYALSFITFKGPFKISVNISRTKLFSLLGALLISMIFVVLEIYVEFQSFVPKEKAVLQNPNFLPQGATPMFISFPWFGRAGIFDAGTDIINFIVLLIFAILIYCIIGRHSFQRLPYAYWHLLVATGVMYAASFFFLIGLSSSLLYQPSRYTRATLFLFVLCFVGLNWTEFMHKAPAWFRHKQPLFLFFTVSLVLTLTITYLLFPQYLPLVPLLWLVSLIFCGFLAIVGFSTLALWVRKFQDSYRMGKIGFVALLFLTIFAGVFYIRTLGLRLINPTESERDIYEFVSTLPKDVVLAGEPVIMSGIPLFSQRSVLFRDLHPNINPNVSIYISDYFNAQYAETPQTIVDFCRRYKVTHFVLDINDFTPDYLAQKDFFYQPWNDEIINIVANRSNFILPKLQPIYASGRYIVLKCDAETINQSTK